MDSIRFLVAGVAAALILSAASNACGAARPNVLVIVSDDLNSRQGCYGFGAVKTPALDGLAAEGLKFRRAYCQYPVCNPSRASFLSGLRPSSTKVLDNTTDLRTVHPDIVTLPQCFRQQGYWTAGVGKVFHGRFHDKPSWDAYEKFDNERNPVFEREKAAFEAKHGPIEKPENRRLWRAYYKKRRSKAGRQSPAGYGPTDMTDAEHKDGKNVRQVVQWLESRAHGEKPFFIICGIQKPHVPFWAPQKYFDLYPPAKIQFDRDPPGDRDDIPKIALNGRWRTFGVPRGDDAKRREVTAAYHACITFIDAQTGLLLNAVKRLGLWDETIVVFTSDHGYHLGEHGMWGKVTLFEECARVPLLVRVPGRTRPATVSPALVELVDLYPTLTELCGVKPPPNLEGTSFAPLFERPERPWKRGAFTVVTRGKDTLGRAVRSQRWRYTEWGGADVAELYDLQADPHERTNLANDPRHQDRVSEMRELLHAGWRHARPRD